MNHSPIRILLGCLSLLACTAVFEPADAADALTKRIRRPVAIVATSNLVFVANERIGSISVVYTKTGTVIAEQELGTRIAHMVELRQSGAEDKQSALLVLCPDEKQLMLVTIDQDSTSTHVIAEIGQSAGRLLWDSARRRVYVAEKWARRIVVLDLHVDLKRVHSRVDVELPFAPQELQLLPDGKTLVVAEAFGGQLAVVDTKQLASTRIFEIKGHNIRGLAVSEDGERLLIAHQKMNPLARADYDDVHWGALVSNGVRVLNVSEIWESESAEPAASTETTTTTTSTSFSTINAAGWLDQFGGIGNATGDPSGVITGSNDLMAVALGGIGEVVIRRAGYSTRIGVGRRPEAMAVNGNRLYVANRFDDSISIIDLDVGKVARTVSLGSPTELSAVDRGELLFFDAKLSHDGWMSCHSCHADGHSSGLLIDTLGDGNYGAPKRVPSLLGTRGTGPWAWNGAMPTLAAQVRKSVSTTMHGEPLSDRQTQDLVAYLESLNAPPPLIVDNEKLLVQGRSVFESHGCHRCHAGEKMTTPGIFDVGLIDEHDTREFNPPSLRGVSQRGRLFHDGRARNLDDVILRFRHKLSEPLSKDESQALLAYLKSR